MSRPSQSALPPRHPRRRRGIASIEMAITLPLLMILVAGTFSVAVLALTKLDLALAARREAWTQRHSRPPARRLEIAVPAFLARVPRINVDTGVAGEIRTREVAIAPAVTNRLFTAESRHYVMGGSWDFQTIPFRPHGRLQPDPRFGVFSPSGNLGIDLGDFGDIPAAVLGAIKRIGR
jgi:TadE-like protein